MGNYQVLLKKKDSADQSEANVKHENISAHSNIGIAAFRPTSGMRLRLSMFSLSYVGGSLETSRSPIERIFTTPLKFHRFINSEWEYARGPNQSREQEDYDKEEENCKLQEKPSRIITVISRKDRRK